jgi:hypothetical protein
MTAPNDVNRQARMVWTILIVLGAMLCVVGWYRWMM